MSSEGSKAGPQATGPGLPAGAVSTTGRTEVMTKLFGYVRGFHATYLMDVGHQLGLFRALRGSAGTRPESLAEELRLDAFYVAKWCETAYSLELLDYDQALGYRLAPFIEDLLADPDNTYFIGAFPNVHLQVARDYAEYPQRFTDGRRISYQEHTSEFFARIAEGTKALPRMLLDVVVPQLPRVERTLQQGGMLLDIGCGAGSALCEFALRYPLLRCVGIDLEPESLRLARELVKERGLQDRVRIERAAERAVQPGAFDFASMLLVLHEIAPERKTAVLRDCFGALKPGGA
ncbi:MAG: methyltransferase domain-containing protein, partial [Chloroflexota bacterium]|nr:methyltransferase domain-containing protein [Chloroflexota bacterium]